MIFDLPTLSERGQVGGYPTQSRPFPSRFGLMRSSGRLEIERLETLKFFPKI